MSNYQHAILLFAEVVKLVMPYAVVWALGQRIVDMYLTGAFRGVMKI